MTATALGPPCLYNEKGTTVLNLGVPVTWRVVPERLEDQAEVLLVVEVSEEAQAVELVVRVGIVEFLQELQLLEPSLLPFGTKRPLR